MADWRVDTLRLLGAPATPQNLKFLGTWQGYEGGHTKNAARFNWLNTTQGNYPTMNSVGVRVFPDYQTGIKQTVATLRNGHYADIVGALQSGDPYKAKPTAGLSTWLSGKPDSANGLAYAMKVLNLANAPAGTGAAPAGAAPAATVAAQAVKPKVRLAQLNTLARQFGFKNFRQAFGFDDDGQVLALLKQSGGLNPVRNLQGGIPVVNNTDGKLPKSVQKVVDLADDYLGTPYVWGGKTPKGFDCSGFVQFLYKQVGIDPGGYTIAQWRNGQAVKPNQLQPGDVVFFNWGTHPETGEEGPQHEGLYLGNGLFIQAPKTGDVVKISRLSDRTDLVGARRYI